MPRSAPSLWPSAYLRNFRWKPSLRIAALTWGTRGDVQPFVALGAELVRRGHRVVLAARAPFRSFVEEHGLEFHELEEDGSEVLMRVLAGGDGEASVMKYFLGYQRSLVRPQFRQFWEASEGADVILNNGSPATSARHIAERRGIPIFQAFFDPGFLPTRGYCLSNNRIQDRGPLFNLATTRLRNLALGLVTWDLVNGWRRQNGLRTELLLELHRPELISRLPVLAAWSPALVERPADWPEWFVQTGRWRLPRQEPTGALADFVAAGPPPVYIGFGSWGVHDRTAMTDILLEALRLTGERAILHRNTVDGRSSFPAQVYVGDELPHDWLFPRMKAVVHHGGAGTTGAVATAGVPSIIIPAFFAQAIWGEVLMEKGIGTLLSRRELRVESLVKALREVTRPEVHERARAIAGHARSEGAERQAADMMERLLGDRRALSGSERPSSPAAAP
jgi:sterol 3beta-glucosyltransferase